MEEAGLKRLDLDLQPDLTAITRLEGGKVHAADECTASRGLTKTI